jgi:hypothetical protein
MAMDTNIKAKVATRLEAAEGGGGGGGGGGGEEDGVSGDVPGEGVLPAATVMANFCPAAQWPANVQIKYISPVTLRVIIAGPVLKRLF